MFEEIIVKRINIFFWKITVSAFFACHPSFYVIDLGSIPDNTFKTGGNLRKSKHNKFSLFFLNTIHKIYNRIHKAYNGFFKKYLFIYIMIIQISGSNKSTFFNLQSFLTIPQFFFEVTEIICASCLLTETLKKRLY